MKFNNLGRRSSLGRSAEHRTAEHRTAKRVGVLLCTPLLAFASTGVAGAQESSTQSLGALGSQAPIGSSGNAPRVELGDQDDFYNIDNVDLNTPGEIVRTQETSYNRLLGQADFNLPDRAQKIMYTSTTKDGTLVPITGYVVEPQVEWKGPGPRPTVVVGRGTVGQGDQCAPSRQWPLDNQPDPLTSGRSVNMEALYDWVFANQGVRVVVTDYYGMGTSPTHTYMNRMDQAHAMIDAARAVKNMVGEDNFGSVGFYGHSQGGGASAAAVEEVGNYAPELDIAGAYSSAPPADLSAVQRHIEGSDLVAALAFSINGLVERYPNLRPIMDKHLSDGGREVLEDASVSCTNEIKEKFGGQTSSMWTTDGISLEEIVAAEPEAQRAMNEQKIGDGVNQAPTMIVAGPHDRTVNYDQSKQLAKNWCEQGGEVVYRDDIMPAIKDYNHFLQAVSGGVFGFDFLLKQFRGQSTPTNCQIADEPNTGSLGVGSSPTGSAEGSVALSESGVLLSGR